ncbi:hypothetical protein [Nitrospina watsonii]|uniref:Uncharacterized protein n=1 Tax=Nitrospina watsonii TaxID=1323948 RepID=A0ABN8W410_9BACT|nr:hypothetical protein [Nitrospina watsonii]CAI2719753.1 conserved protein of unknown function [Nitrospina watsonii]
MNFPFIELLTPYVTLLLTVGIWVVGWLMKKLIAENDRHFSEVKTELKAKIDERGSELEKRIDKLENGLEVLERSRLADHKYLYEQFVHKDGFHHTAGRTESAIGRIFKQLNELNRVVNQNIGASQTHD